MSTKWVVIGKSAIIECETLIEAKETLLEYDDKEMEMWEVTKRYRKETIANIVEVED